MHKRMMIKIYLLLIIALNVNLSTTANSFSIVRLKCENCFNPVGIDTQNPLLGWQIETLSRNWFQGGYRIIVASNEKLLDEERPDIWDTGVCKGSQSNNVRYQGVQLKSNDKYFWRVCVWNETMKDSVWSSTANWTNGFPLYIGVKPTWISSKASQAHKGVILFNDKNKIPPCITPDSSAVYMRKEFSARKSKRAVVHISGLGYYELYLNGNKVGDHMLDPNFTDYTQRINYVSYDVTGMINEGVNCIGVILGNGFFNTPTPDLFGMEESCWRSAPKMLFKMVVEYDDGSMSEIVSDGSWKHSNGEIIFNCIRGGETIDHRITQHGWNMVGFNDMAWFNVVETRPPFGKLSAQIMPPMRIVDTVKTLKMTQPKPGVYVFDLGKNMTGVPVVRINGVKGQVLTVDCNEMLLKDGTVDTAYCSSHTYGRFQQNRFILSGDGEEVFAPRFSYHGMRYIQIRGLHQEIAPEQVVAHYIHTDLSTVGSFECSDTSINNLHLAVRRTLLDCIHSMPGEEPIREKMGWTQDAQNTMNSYVYNFDSKSTFVKYMRDMIDSQEPNGHIPPIAPTNGWGNIPSIDNLYQYDDPWWGASLAVIADNLYSYYGDATVIAEAYKPMARYLVFLGSIANNYLINWSLGDWVDKTWDNSMPGMTSVEVTSTLAYYHLCCLQAKFAQHLNLPSDIDKYNRLASKIQESFLTKYFDITTGKVERGSQTAQAVALQVGIIPEQYRNIAEKQLLNNIEEESFHVNSGFIGVMPTLNYLAENIDVKIAYRMINQREGSGWFHMIEDANSSMGESLYQDGTGNHHHPFGTCIGSWFYAYVLGIRNSDNSVGFRDILLQPSFIPELTYARGVYETPYGVVVSDWKRDKKGRVNFKFTVPPNTSAKVVLPSSRRVTEKGKIIKINSENSITVGSGTYNYLIEL